MPEKKSGIVSGGRTSVGRGTPPDASKGTAPGASGVVSGGSSQLTARDEHTQESYTVVKGDSLSKIAKRVYGKASLWPKIYEANRGQIKDPDLIFPGQVLRIPTV